MPDLNDTKINTDGGDESQTLLAGAGQKADEKPPEVKPAEETKPEEQKAGEQKPEEKKEEKPEQKAPEKYEFKLPDGAVADEKLIGDFSTVAKDLNLTQEQAQKVVDLYTANLKNQEKSFQDAFAEQEKTWIAEVKQQPNYQENLSLAKKAVEYFSEGDNDAKNLVLGTWLGNHPAMIRMMARIGKVISEDSFISAHGTSTKKDPAEILYPSGKK